MGRAESSPAGTAGRIAFRRSDLRAPAGLEDPSRGPPSFWETARATIFRLRGPARTGSRARPGILRFLNQTLPPPQRSCREGCHRDAGQARSEIFSGRLLEPRALLGIDSRQVAPSCAGAGGRGLAY